MLVMGTLYKTPELAQRVPHGLPFSRPLGEGFGAPTGAHMARAAAREPAWLRARAQCSSSMSSTQSWWLDIISRH